MTQRDTGGRSFAFEPRVVAGWSPWWIFSTRISNTGYRRGDGSKLVSDLDYSHRASVKCQVQPINALLVSTVSL